MRKTLLVILALALLINISSCSTREDKLSIVEKLNRGDKLYREGNLDKAEDIYKDIIKSYRDSPEAYISLSKIYRDRGDFKSEEKVLLKGLNSASYTNDMRMRLIEIYLEEYQDMEKGTGEILNLLRDNLHSYKFDFILEEYKDYVTDEKFNNIIYIYKNYNHEERLPAYLISEVELNPTEGNKKSTLEKLDSIKINKVSPKLQNKILGFYMKYGTGDEVENLVKDISKSNTKGSIFGAYNHWLQEYKGEYILEDLIKVDTSGDGIEENILLLTKEQTKGLKEYSLEIQDTFTGEIYDKYIGTSEFETLSLEYPLQNDPREHMINLVQTRTGDEFEFIDVFFVANKKIRKAF